MKSKKLLLSFLLVCIFVLQTDFAFASDCFLVPPPCKAFWENDAIFVGLVTAMSSNYQFVMKVEKPYRGVKQDEELTVNQTLGYCDDKFEIGKRYVVYANKSSNRETLSTLVDSTSLFSEDLSSVKFFESLNDGKPEFSIVIQPSRFFDPNSLKGKFKVDIWKNEQYLFNKESSIGYFDIKVPEEGQYKVRIWIPDNKTISFTNSSDRITLK